MAKQSGLSFYKRKKKISSKAVREVFSWIFSILATAFLAVALVYFFGMRTSVVGSSMEPRLLSEQEILVDRFIYVLSSPDYGDVVLFLPNGNQNSHYYTKRVVARPGDTVVITDGVLYVNGTASDLVTEKIYDAGIAENELVLGTGEYFVIGDNTFSSEDSRSANIGPVSDTDIVGKVWFSFATDDGGELGFVKSEVP